MYATTQLVNTQQKTSHQKHRHQTTERFWRLTEKELRRLYKTKALTAVGYIEGIFRLNAPGFKGRSTVKEFCLEWGISRRNFYYAIKKLPEDVHIEWKDNAPFEYWHGGSVVSLPTEKNLAQTAETLTTQESQSAVQSIVHTVTPKTPSSTNTEKELSQTAETLTKQELQSAVQSIAYDVINKILSSINTDNLLTKSANIRTTQESQSAVQSIVQEVTNHTVQSISTEKSFAQPVKSFAQPVQSIAQPSPETLATQASCDAKDNKDKKRYLSERDKKLFPEKKELASGNSDGGEESKQIADSVSTLAKKMSVPSTRKSPPEEQTSPVRLNVSKDETIVNSPNFCLWLESYKKAEGHRIKNGKAYVAACLKNRGEGREDILDLYRKWQRLTVNLDGEQTEYLGYEVPDFTAPERGHDWHKKINDEWERLAQREVDFGSELDFAVAKASEEMSNKYRWFGHWVNFASKNYPSLKINPQPRNLNDTDASLNAREKIRAQIEAARKKNKAQRAANREKMARGE